MEAYRPYVAPKLSLNSLPLEDLCKDDVLGYCRDRNCTKHHIITLIDGDTGDYVDVEHPDMQQSPINTLTYTARQPISRDYPLDEDGPGVSSPKGPRHDNDKVDITKIQILPTVDEIICLRPPYIPRKDVTVHQDAPSRLLECHFRQLRYDNTETIVDACYDGFQKAIWSTKAIYDHRQETLRGVRYTFLQEVKFESFHFHEFMGAIFRLSFECPRKLRGPSILISSLLEKGKMCALLAVHDNTQEVNVILFESFLRESTDTLKHTGSTTRAAIQVCPANKDDISAVRQAAYYAKGLFKMIRFFLLDLPDVLAAGFVDHLQKLKDFYCGGDFPFSDAIAPRIESQFSNEPPAYSLKQGFQFDLNCLRGTTKDSSYKDLLITPGSSDPGELQRIIDLTTLDEGQAVALHETLNRRVAFTQGPPGTGKTFLGVAEAEVILKSQPEENRKPIVVVCMTNHALDDFVSSLIERKITKVVRLGNRSACDWMEKFLLTVVSKRVKANSDEKRSKFEARTQAETLAKLGLEWAEELSREPGLRSIQAHLARCHPEIANLFDYLDRVSVREVDFNLLTRSSAGYAFGYWIHGGDLRSIAALMDTSLAATSAVSEKIEIHAHASVTKVLEAFRAKVGSAQDSAQHIWNLELAERKELLAQWLSNVSEWSLCEAFAEIHRRHHEARKRFRRQNQELDVRSILEQKIDIVALTATGCARNWDFLSMLQPHTYLMEEASELTEASTIAAMVRSTQHLIKIGDPLQLRPHIALQALCKENDDRYRLDESLFERLMGKIPFSRLNTQRRAHPDLADLLRASDYPYLIDHPSTEERAEVPGLFTRLYWVHHDIFEDTPDPLSALAKSSSNMYEVRFISNTVKYLIERHAFRYNTITILTPYNGQVALFVRHLRSFCQLTLTKEDKEALVDAGMLEADELDNKSAVSVELGAMLRITTIDNYQGEENDVVFFSPVKSNKEGKVGFLKNQNRINVAISRARNGFYVVGNALQLEKAPQWAPIVDTFRHKNALTRGLPVLSCSKHCNDEGDGARYVRHPDGFKYIPQCAEACQQLLPCGHPCNEKCHPDEMHHDGRIICTKICGILLECGHQCGKYCHQKCHPCVAPLKAQIMPCGHMVSPLCSQDTSTVKCDKPRGRRILECGHMKTVTCNNEGEELKCDETCGRVLECGHKCKRECSDCMREGACLACTELCEKNLPCGHQCDQPCHRGKACPTCMQPCLKACRHGKCQLRCSVICDPCVREGDSTSCPHQERAILCCLPGTYIPCSQPCSLTLSCGLHVCPGLCGEPCPEECLECNGRKSLERTYTLSCQHTFPVTDLDVKLGLENLYSFGKDGTISHADVKCAPDPAQLQCPTCGSSTIGSPRYALAHQLLNGQDIIGRLYAKVGRRLRHLANEVFDAEDVLFKNLNEFCGKMKPGPLAVWHNTKMLDHRLAQLNELYRDVQKNRDELAQPVEEAILKFSKMVNNPVLFPTPVLSMNLRFERVYYRCRFLFARFRSMVAAQLKKMTVRDEYIDLFIQCRLGCGKELSEDISALEALVVECKEKHLKRLEVEFVIARTSAVISARDLGLSTPVLAEDFKRASNLCATYPNSAGCLRSNLSEANSALMSCVSSLSLEDKYHKESRPLWSKVGWVDENGPKYCEHGHLFSERAFSKGCPECGVEKKM